MTASLIINTCCMDPLATGPWYGTRPYADRKALIEDHILRIAKADDWDEVIVCGQYEDGDGYTYIPMDPIFRDRRDALWQRELGARHATSRILAFCHDDHTFQPDTARKVKAGLHASKWDILVPARISDDGERLNNGKDEDYMGGHALLIRRELWASVPWTATQTEWWDRSMTRIWREEGAEIVWTDEITHIDLDT